MATLGTISVSFTANTAKFSNAIRGMTQRLNSFSKAAQSAHASMKPFMAGMSSVSQSVSTTGARMAQSAQSMGVASKSLAGVGQTAQSTSTNIYALGNGLHNVLTNFSDVGGSAATVSKQTNSMTQTFQGAGETADMFANRVKNGNAALQKTIPTGYKVQSSFKLMADGSLSASRRIAKDMAYNKAQMSMFSNFMGKISHYIQFTIGVQLVMKIVQGFQSMVETMKEFEKQAVRTAGVAGRLGGSFDATVENIKAVSAQLGRETIFSATEAAGAMYDLASAGFDVAEAMESVETGVSAVGPIIYYAAAQQIELSEATGAVSRALKMFNMDLTDSEHVVDIFTAAIANSFLTAEKLRDALRYSGAMAHTLGISLEETVAANMALADAGLKGSQAGQRLNMILTKLLKPTEKAKKTLAAMGLTMEDISPQTHTLTEMLQTLQSAGFGAGEAANFFRARTAGAAAVLIKNAENMEAYRMTLLGAEGMTRELAERQRTTLWGSFKLVSAAAESTAIKLGELLRPSLEWLAGFIRSTVLPAVDAVVGGFQWMEENMGPLVPLIKSFTKGLAVATVAMLAYNAATLLATRASALFAGISLSNPLFAAAAAIGVLVGALLWLNDKFDIFNTIATALTPVIDAVVGAVKDLIEWLKPLGNVIGYLVMTLTPLGPLLAMFSMLQKDAQKSELNKYVRELSEETENYSDALDELNTKLDEQRKAEEEVARVTADETSSAKDLIDAKANLENVTEQAEEAEKRFLATSSQLIQAFAKLSENLDTFTGALGKVDEIEDRIERKQSSLQSTTEALADMQNEYNEAVRVYGSRSQEAMDIMDEMVKTRKEEIDLTEEIASLTSNELNDALAKQAEEYENLSYAEKLMADQEMQLLETEENYKKSLIESQSLQAKQNVLLSTRNNFEKFYEDRVQALRDAESKLYDIELKLYQLRKNQVNNMRSLFDAFADSGMLTQEMIRNYSDMEKAQGALIREQVSYSKTLDSLSKENRQSVANWTESFITGMNEGMTESEAFSHATSQTGQSISDLVGQGTQAYNKILDYAQASHEATSTTNMFRDESMGLASDLVETGQATSDVANAYYSIKNSANEVENAEKDLKDELVSSKDATEGVISSVGRLFQYYAEVEGLEGNRTKILQEMIKTMGLQEEVGTSNASILQKLNKFYGVSNESLDDFTQSQSIAALTAMRLGESMEGISAESIRADDLIEELPIDSFEQWGNIANKVIQNQEDEFDTLKGDIQSNNAEIDKYVDMLAQLSDFEGIQIAEEEPEGPDWLKGFTDALGGVKDALYDAFVGLGMTIWDIIDVTASTISSGAQAIWDGIVSVFGTIWDLLGAGASAITSFASDLWKGIKDGLGSIWSALGAAGNSAKNWAINLWNAIKYNVGNLFSVIGASASGLQSLGSDLWSALKSNVGDIGDLIGGISSFVSDLASNLITALTGIISIENLFSGLQGFTDALASGWNAVANFFGFSGGAIVKAANGIARTSGPTAAIIGEAGAEAVVPLEGVNRRNGLAILQDIIPKHFPELTSSPMQAGAIVSGTTTSGSNTVVHQYDIHGDINVYSPANGDEAVDEILRRLEDKRRLANR